MCEVASSISRKHPEGMYPDELWDGHSMHCPTSGDKKNNPMTLQDLYYDL